MIILYGRGGQGNNLNIYLYIKFLKDNTWEPRENLTNALDLLKEYELR